MRADVILLLSMLFSAAPAAAQLALTPPQTEGPYYPRRMMPTETDPDLTRIGNGPQANGDVLALQGTVVDPSGKAIAGARVEIWQTDHQGIYMHPAVSNTNSRDKAFQFYGIATTDTAGAFAFRTIIPKQYPGRARHIHVKITPPGGTTLTTQLYFAGDGDLGRDGIARALGKALADVTLSPAPGSEPGVQSATTRFVVRRAKAS